MSDDGLMMNLSFEPVSERKLSAKATKAQNLRRKRAGPAANAVPNASDLSATGPVPRPAALVRPAVRGHVSKKVREHGDETPAADTAGGEFGGVIVADGPSDGVGGGGDGKRKQVISSLFTKNPDIPVLPEPSVLAAQKTKGLRSVFEDTELVGPDATPLVARLTRHLQEQMGIDRLTTVQRQSMPSLLVRRDTLIKSPTGSGKTLAYALPLVHDLQGVSPKIKREDGPYAIILLPTRELAIQSFETLQMLLKTYIWIVPGILMGGEKKKSEKARLRKGVNVLVATPGRLLDHLDHTRCLDLSHVRWLVLDEADRLLDQGFEKDVLTIVQFLNDAKAASHTPRCNVLLSATLNESIERLAKVSLSSPRVIDCTSDAKSLVPSLGADGVTGGAGEFSTAKGLTQYFVMVPCKLRLVTLAAFLKWKAASTQENKIIVFTASRDTVQFYQRLLTLTLSAADDDDEEEEQEQDGGSRHKLLGDLPLYFLHGGLTQQERTLAFHQFSEAKRGVLISTDVAARGLHLPKVNWIVQLSAPTSPAEYVHRVGRTARMDAQGNALIFLMPSETEYLKVLDDCKFSLVEMPFPAILSRLTAVPSDSVALSEPIKTAATALQLQFERAVQHDQALSHCAALAHQSFIRAYSTYPSEQKHIFHIKSLHLGHVAKSFGLRTPPTAIAASAGPTAAANSAIKDRKDRQQKAIYKEERQDRKRKNTVDEFTPSAQSLPPKKKRKLLVR